MRDFKITRKKGEWYQNYFEQAHEANEWIYYIWENEEWFNSVDQDELLAGAIHDCKQIDKQKNIKAIL